MNTRFWLSRSLPLLVVALVVLALGLFIEWPAPWSAAIGLIGAVLLAAWVLGFPRRGRRERHELVARRERQAERRQREVEVRAERRSSADRRAEPRSHSSS